MRAPTCQSSAHSRLVAHAVCASLKALLIGAVILLMAPSVYAQHTVSGTVMSDEGFPLPGVNVLVVGTTIGAATNVDGEYEVRAPSGTATLQFSYIGYVTQQIPIEGRSVIDVTLEFDAIMGDELVVVGYGVQRRRDVTGAIARVEGEEISRLPTLSAEQALQGRVAGVQVVPSSGEPGAGATIRIRGVGTLNNANPLFVVDGMLLDDINFLNPNDIQSVDVLKDASATAIYGSRGANGVIIVTTRRASPERPIVNFNTYVGVEQLGRRIDVANAREFAMLANELATNLNQTPPYENPDAFGEGTDWQSEVYQNAPIQNYQFSASGMTERLSYYVSGNYSSQDGIVPKSDFRRASFRLNNDYRISDFVTVGHNLSMSYTDFLAAPGVMGTVYRAMPTIAPFTDDGAYSDLTPVGNPLASIEYTMNDRKGQRTVGNVFADILFLRDFTFRSSLGLDVNRSEGRNFSPIFFVSPTQQSSDRSISVFNNFSRNILWENTLTYRRFVGAHSINLLGGVTMQENRFESLGGARLGVVGEDPALWYLNSGEQEGMTNYNGAAEWGMLSYLARVNYGFMDRYLLTLSLRADGSSRFGSENRYGYFPSVALGWVISDEPFMGQQRIFDNLKLRGSYGVIGNDKIGEYPSAATISPNLNAVFGIDEMLQFGQSLIALTNPRVAWESTEQLNFGLEMAFLANRLTAEIDYYNRTTNDILSSIPIPGYVGVNASPVVNAASVRNTGLDFTLNFRNTAGDFSYRLGAVGSTVNNEVLSLGEGREEIFGGPVGEGGKLATRTIVGGSIGDFYGYRVAGVFQNADEVASLPKRGPEVPGDLRFEDINGDGRITTADRTYLGSPIPDFIFGFNFGFGWRGLDLDLDFNGQTGNLIYNAKKAARFGTYNFERSYLDRWTGEGTSSSEPRVTNAGHNYEVSDRFLEDGSYLKLRNIRLSYAIPPTLTQQVQLRNARVYVNGSNLVTLTGYSGHTPEVGTGNVFDVGVDRGFYPPNRSFTVGLDLTF
jgi:TonB-linked SusC/RagA family outer membrane protein